MAEIKLTKQNFENEVSKADKPMLIDFWATWCGPCRMIGPVVEEIAREFSDTVKVGKVNVDEERDLASRFQILSIPTFLVLRGGKVVASAMGARPKEQILAMLDA